MKTSMVKYSVLQNDQATDNSEEVMGIKALTGSACGF